MKVRCPKCGFVFDVSYARIVSCRSCPMSVLSCDYIKCPNCGHEFTIEEGRRFRLGRV